MKKVKIKVTALDEYEVKDKEMAKQFISDLEKIKKAIPKVISELKKGDYGSSSSTSSGLVSEMLRVNQTDWYEHFYG